jgi:acetylglutamate kinase
MKAPRVLIKVGGAALTEETTLNYVTEAIQQFRLDGHRVIVVHGGGPAINSELTRQGIEWKFLNGQRVTTPAMMGIIESTLCGQVNSMLVRHFVASGISAVGLSGADHRTLLCTPQSEELGLVGAIQQVNSLWIEELLRVSSYPVPVIAPVGVGLNGQAYNINADWAAARLASALQVDQLIFLTDQAGVLDSEKQVYRTLSEKQIHGLIEDGTVHGGMMTKMRSVLYALNAGIGKVRVMNGRDAAFACNGDSFGTSCVLNSVQIANERVEAYAAV